VRLQLPPRSVSWASWTYENHSPGREAQRRPDHVVSNGVGLRGTKGREVAARERKGTGLMKRSFITVALCVALVGALAVPALGAVDSNPNASELTSVSCDDGRLFFETIWVASQSSVAGHDLEGNTVGVAKSLYITDDLGMPQVELFHRPGRGLDNTTVWCFWPDAGSPTGFIGGDVLFNARLR